MGIVESIAEQNVGVYRASFSRLKEDVSQEAQVASDYRGRLAYELLQNADDAMDRGFGTEDRSDTRDRVKFIVTDDALWMANNGRPLSDADVQGLCGLGASSKVGASRGRRASIGHKGLGFTSVLEITDRPTAMSTTISFELAEEHARKHVGPLLNELGKSAERSLPVMRFPNPHNPTDQLWEVLRAEGYTTAFKFPFRDDLDAWSRSHLVDILIGLPLTTVLFLKHLDEVEIQIEMAERRESRRWHVSRSRKEPDHGWTSCSDLVISGVYRVQVESSGDQSATFLVVLDADVEIGDHRSGLSGPAWDGVTISEVSLAVLEPGGGVADMPREWRRFHVFLPTGEPNTYPILVNGAFVTDMSRQSLRVDDDETNYNAYLVRRAASLFGHLVSELKADSAHELLGILERDQDIGEGEAASLFHAALSDALRGVPLLPGEDGTERSFDQLVVPPTILDSDGETFRAVLRTTASWEGRYFPVGEYCVGRWAAVAVDHGSLELTSPEAVACLARQADAERSRAFTDETGMFQIDPILDLCASIALWTGSEDLAETTQAVRDERLFPIRVDGDGLITRAAIGESHAFFPPQSGSHDLPLEGLRFMAHEICWGQLSRRDREQVLGHRISDWANLFHIREFRFDAVMEAAVLPGLVLRDDEELEDLQRSLASMEVLAAICDLAGRTPKPESPLRYQRLGGDRAFFNLARLPVPCRRRSGEVEWVPAYTAYFGRDWIGDESAEDLLDQVHSADPSADVDAPFVLGPEAFRGLISSSSTEDVESSGDEVDGDDEVEVGEDIDRALESDEIKRWRDFLTWIGVNAALRPIHFHDVGDRASGWLSTKGLSHPGGWAFQKLGGLWDRYRRDVLEVDARVVADDVDPYLYQVHDLEWIVPILATAEKDETGDIGSLLIDHLARHSAYYEEFADAVVALVDRGKYPSQRSKPPRAMENEIVTVGANLWLYRLTNRAFVPTTHGPRRASDTWLRSDEVERRFGRRNQEAGQMLPLLSGGSGVPDRQLRTITDRLGIRGELSPSTFGIEDARLLCHRIAEVARASAFTDDAMRSVIRPAYRELFELLASKSQDDAARGALRDVPLLAVVAGGFEILPAREVFYARTPGFRQRSGVDALLPAFVIEAESSATAPLLHLFEVNVLEDALDWVPDPGESPFTDEEESAFRGGLIALRPELLARIRAERSLARDVHALGEFLEKVEAVDGLDVTCSFNGRLLSTGADREYFVDRHGGRAFVLWGGRAWPPEPDDAQRLAMALADALEVNLVETFLAFVMSDEAQRRRLLDMAGASGLLDDAVLDLQDPPAESDLEPAVESVPTIRATADVPPDDEEAPTLPQSMSQESVTKRIPLVSLEDLVIDGIPIVVSGEAADVTARDRGSRVNGHGGSSGTVSRAPAGTDLLSLDHLGMRITASYELARLRHAGSAHPLILEAASGSIGPDSVDLVVDVSTPQAIREAEEQSPVVRRVLADLEQEGVSLLFPGFDVLTIIRGRPDRLIELKSSGVDARVQAMSWNEWKSASHSELRHLFWLYLVGNLRADLPGVPFVRAIHDPFGALTADVITDERVSRAVQLRVREFSEAEHLDLG